MAKIKIDKKVPKLKKAITIDATYDKKISELGFKRSEFIHALLKNYFENEEKEEQKVS